MFEKTEKIIHKVVSQKLCLDNVYRFDWNGTVFYVDAYTAYAVAADDDFLRLPECPDSVKEKMKKNLTDIELCNAMNTGEIRDVSKSRKAMIFKDDSGKLFGINKKFYDYLPKHGVIKVSKDRSFIICYESDIPIAVIACIMIRNS